MSKQLIFSWASGTIVTNATFLNGRSIGGSQHNSEPMVIGGSFTNWFIKLTVAPGGVTSRTFTVHKNNSPTALTITISGTDLTGQYTGAAVTFAAGDSIRLVRVNSGSPAAANSMSCIEFTPDTANLQIHGFSAGTVNTANDLVPLFNGSAGGTVFFNTGMVPADGVISAFRVKLADAPGAGTSRIYTIFKNAVAQDGTGGTPNTVITISDANTEVATTFSLSVAAGDFLACKMTVSGVPAGLTWSGGNIAYTPTQSGTDVLAMTGDGAAIDGTSEYNYPNATGEIWGTTQVQLTGGLTNIRIKSMRVKISNPAGAAKSWTFTLQVDGVDTALAVTISGASDTTGVTTVAPPITITSANKFNIRSVAAGTPSSTTDDQRITLASDSQSSPNKGGGGKGKKGGTASISQFGPSLLVDLDTVTTYGYG